MDYQTEKHMIISLIAVTVSLTVGLVLINFAHAQEDGKSMVDELTKNLQELQSKDQAYKEELINRLTGENSTCTYLQIGPILTDMKDFDFSKEKIQEKLRESLGALPVEAAEATYKRCFEEGKIK